VLNGFLKKFLYVSRLYHLGVLSGQQMGCDKNVTALERVSRSDSVYGRPITGGEERVLLALSI